MQGAEREAVICLLQRAHEYAAQGEPLGVKAAFAHDHIKVQRSSITEDTGHVAWDALPLAGWLVMSVGRPVACHGDLTPADDG